MPQHRQLLIALLLAASALADLAICLPRGARFWPEPLHVLTLALAASQVSLLTVWVSLSSRGPDLRLCLVALFCGAAAWCSHRHGDEAGDTYVLLISLATFELLLLVPLRWRGLRIRLADAAEAVTPGGRPQFTLSGLMGWTASLALALGLGRAFVAQQAYAWPLVIVLLIVLAFSMAVLACLAVWAACARDRAGWRMLLVLVMGPAFSLPAQAVVPHWRSEVASTAGLFLALASLLIGALGVFRVAGYRLLRTEGAADANRPLAA